MNRLQARGWRRGWATGLLLFVTFLLLSVIFLIFVGTLINGITNIAEQVPAWADQVQTWASDTLGVDLSTESIGEGAQNIANAVSTLHPGEFLLGLTGSLVGGIFAMFTVGMFLFYMVAEAPKFKRAVLAFFPTQKQERLVYLGGGDQQDRRVLLLEGPADDHQRRALLHRRQDPRRARRRAARALPGIRGGVHPDHRDVHRRDRPADGRVLLGRATDTLILLIYVLIYQQVENYLTAPRLQSKTMEMHPAVAFGRRSPARR